ncbi:MAG: ATP-dependent 6-phosphofructokinase [Candidatus Bathyarchaeia archaeon]
MAKKLGVVTSGGDAPGMNAAVRAVTRTAIAEGLEVIGYQRGYAGLLDAQYIKLDARAVGGIIHQGGTFLKTSRADRMKTDEGISEASEVLKEHSPDGLIVIGGDGSFRAASKISHRSGVPVIGIPATIDNDLAGTETTIGFDTAVNTGVSAIDKIRDTATSHERVFIVEVMGRGRGFIALEVGISTGAEIILIPEIEYDEENVCARLEKSRRSGKRSGIIVMAEGAGDCVEVGDFITRRTGFEVRLTRLGHLQRGGPPTALSRLLASRMGFSSIKFLLRGERNIMTALKNGAIIPVDLEYACTRKKKIDVSLYELASLLST